MRLIRLPGAEPPPGRPPAVVATVGNFDGVHLGHRALLQHVKRRAREHGAESAVVTFDPHPRLVLRPDVPLRQISALEEKLALLEEVGIDRVIVWRFDAALQQLDAESFMRELSRYVTLKQLVHGPGFALGRKRHGTPEVLAEIGSRIGFTLEELDLLQLSSGAAQGAPVTSTAVRTQIEDGKIGEATAALGRPPTVAGVVVEGEKMGRQLGYPTANLDVGPHMAVPADGVYAAWAELEPFSARAVRLPAAVSIGTRPTFQGRRRVVEAYLLDFAGDLYGKLLRLHFVARLRGQEAFESIEALIAQMNRDVNMVRAVLDDERAAGRAPVSDLALAADG